ncbi:MAG: Na+/proline symporter [Candidatus Endobugula sp.]|jgi:Na+/proline symporter
MLYTLIAILLVIAIISFALSPRVQTADGFFKGLSASGDAPSLWTLVLSQVTTWIFARSLLTAAILGYYYGIAGALAYAAYYVSFLTGGAIIDHLRFTHGKHNIQRFMHEQFGVVGNQCYNLVIALRLLSEVFSNLLVVILAFGVTQQVEYLNLIIDNLFYGGNTPIDYTAAIAVITIAIITFLYSTLGGLRASLRTDVLQAILVILALAMLFAIMLFHNDFSFTQVILSSPDIQSPGWVLLAVAFLQVWSYPLHDPVMMDRGFLADRETTRKSFNYAAAISIVCIFVFALLGVFAGVLKADGEVLISTLTRLFGEPCMIIFNVALVISAVSTLDSTFSSASKLVAVDMNIIKPTPTNGRWVMLIFLMGGSVFLFFGSKDLFAAVAVSGTVSMFLAPVIFFNIWGKQRTQLWPLVLSFITALAGGLLYMLESSGHTDLLQPLFGYSHKYSKLLIICISILVVGCVSFYLGQKKQDD